MKNKEKKLKKTGKEKLKKKNKTSDNSSDNNSGKKGTVILELKGKINTLEALLKKRDQAIEKLQQKLVESKSSREKKQKKQKFGSGAAKLLRSQRSNRVGLSQRDAWRRHGYLRDRYEYHLEHNEDKGIARQLAGQDLIEKFGEEAGYSELQLEQILS
ncbi:MAG: hypothetical protein ABW104_09795 [Candidatus Thiodiazotropha sp. 6PLUC2]